MRNPHPDRSQSARRRHCTPLAFAGITALALPLLAAPSAYAAPETSIVINEVIQNNDVIDDTVELMNIGTEPVDISGWIIADDKDREPQLTLPAGTVLEPGAFLAVLVDTDGDEGFGLGKEDMARLIHPDGTEIDRFEWSGHQPTSYGLNPDGVGEIAVTSAATPGAPNEFALPGVNEIVINEVVSSGGEPGDWVELLNTGDATVDLSGWIFSDNDDTHTYVLPAGTELAAGEYLVLDELKGDAPGFDFGLGGNDSARLFHTDGVTLVDETSWSTHGTPSWGRCPTGVGDFANTAAATKGAANECDAPEIPAVVINEIETSGGTPDDWIEFLNIGETAVDLSGFIVRDDSNADDHTWEFPAGTEIAPGEFLVVESASLGYGLGAADQARLFLPGGHTIVDQHAWSAHSPTTIGRCPDGTGDFRDTTASTKGAPNDCSAAVRINEVESNGDPSGDWVELVNAGFAPADISGMSLRDGGAENDAIVLPAGTVLEAGEYLQVFTEPTFGLGGNDLVQLLDVDGITVLDETEWSGHASVTWGRCPDMTGEFGETRESTPGAANACEGDLITEAWSGPSDVAPADEAGYFGDDMSGVVFDPASTVDRGIVWAVNNGAGTLHKLVLVDGAITEDEGWIGGRKLRYPDGAGTVDAEGVTMAGEPNVVYVGSERNNDGGGSRPSVLRYVIDESSDELVATHEWNLTEYYPGIGANAGIEGVAWISDDTLVAGGLVDENTGTAYNPASYAPHAAGVFFVAVEATNEVAGYVLADDGTMTRVTAFETAFPGVMELEYEPATGELWAICDDVCGGLSQIFALSDGAFAATAVIQPPSGMDPSFANEGLAFAPQAMCVDSAKPVVWADDAASDGHAFRVGSIGCQASGLPDGTGGESGETGGSGEDPIANTGTATPLYLAAFGAILLVAGALTIARRASL